MTVGNAARAGEGPPDVREVVVVGGGVAGLSAAWHLRDRDVLLLEASERLGGRMRSEPRGAYWLNLGAHVFAGPGTATGRLVEGAGIELVPVPGHLVALELNGRIVVGGRPELYPFRLRLSMRERLALLRAGARLRLAVARYERAARPRPGETPAETRRRVVSFGDDRTFADWLGDLPGDAAALFRATVNRSTAELDEISFGHGAGYFALVWSAGSGLSHNVVGGAGVLVDRIAAALPGRVETGAEVRSVRAEGDAVRVLWAQRGGERETIARHVVVATKAFDAARIVSGLPSDTRSALESIPYGPTVVMAMLTRESGPMPWDGLYALATPKRSFNMLFNVVNVLRPRSPRREPGGSLMVYRSGHAALELFEQPDDAVARSFVDDLYAIYPEARGIVEESILLKLPRMLPYVAPGRSRLQPALERPLGRVHLAGDYLGGSYTDTAISSGEEAAQAIRSALDAQGEGR
ncbi:MAG TPA: NAD(P)/FAD-dependent oxidoreductase [Gaiellaceae bacterium]|nr:NAD(P)/FAD-dependent oxidoreductase [Gaiellaceae bacterium]